MQICSTKEREYGMISKKRWFSQLGKRRMGLSEIGTRIYNLRDYHNMTKRACSSMSMGAGSFHALITSLLTIFSCTTSIFVSFLHFGQYSGKLTRTVSAYTLVRDRFPHVGHGTQRESLSCIVIISPLVSAIPALRCMSGSMGSPVF